MYEPIFYGDTKNMTEYERHLYVVSAGAYLFKKHNSARDCLRSDGRSDYHFVCVMNGRSECTVDGRNYTLDRGKAVFYGRNAPQYYKHFPTEEGTEIYWIHFDGEDADALLSECGFKESFVFSFSSDIRPMFDGILGELLTKDPLYMKSASALLFSLIVTLSKELMPKRVHDGKIENVKRMMNNPNNETLSLSHYAELCGLSVPQFIKRFTKATGLTPMKYRSQRIIHAAHSYLENTSMSIREISEILKFENSYYFSNMFKKHTGVSPKTYRENFGKRQNNK